MWHKRLVQILVGILLLTVVFSVPILAADDQDTTETTQVKEEKVTLWKKMKQIFGLESEREEVDDAVVDKQLTEIEEAIQEMEGLTAREREELSAEVKTQLQESYQNHPSGKIPTGLVIKSLREKVEDEDLNIKEAGEVVSKIARDINQERIREKEKAEEKKKEKANENSRDRDQKADKAKDKNRDQDRSDNSSSSNNNSSSKSSNKSSGGSSKGRGK